jgi:hypothetical protein
LLYSAAQASMGKAAGSKEWEPIVTLILKSLAVVNAPFQPVIFTNLAFCSHANANPTEVTLLKPLMVIISLLNYHGEKQSHNAINEQFSYITPMLTLDATVVKLLKLEKSIGPALYLYTKVPMVVDLNDANPLISITLVLYSISNDDTLIKPLKPFKVTKSLYYRTIIT